MKGESLRGVFIALMFAVGVALSWLWWGESPGCSAKTAAFVCAGDWKR